MPSAKRKGEKMRIIFMGTPDFAVPSLQALLNAGHDVCAVYTQPPRPSGRKMLLQTSPVHKLAEANAIPVFTPTSLKSAEVQAEFVSHGADVAIVAAYGVLLPQAILDAPKYGCINVHASLLPRWRGAAPVHRAILAGDAETGVCIMQMEVGLDTGPVFATAKTEIAQKTGAELTAELAQIGANALIDVLNHIPDIAPEPQDGVGVTYATKLDKSELHIDFLTSAPQVSRQIRAFSPQAWFEFAGERFRIVSAEILPPDGSEHGPATVVDDALGIACNPGVIRPILIQRAGKSVMTVADLLRGFSITAGSKLT